MGKKQKQQHTTITHDGQKYGVWVLAEAETHKNDDGSYGFCINFSFTWDKSELNKVSRLHAIVSGVHDTLASAGEGMKAHFALRNLKRYAGWDLRELLAQQELLA